MIGLRVKRIRWDESGASMIEFSIVALLLLLLVGGVVEFSLVFFQWNSATKALQQGVRLASVSDPVAIPLKTLTGVGGTVVPGDPMPAFNYVCSGATASCTPGGTTDYSAAA